jgi:hypothetical protein
LTAPRTFAEGKGKGRSGAFMPTPVVVCREMRHLGIWAGLPRVSAVLDFACDARSSVCVPD